MLSKRTDADHDTQWADAAPVVAPAMDNLNDASENGTVRIWEGTQAQFDALTSRSGDTIYIISDNGASVDAVSDTLPIGTVLNYSSDVMPLNWILCNGQAVSRYDYAELFSIIGTAFGTGDGLSTFNVPDMRGRVCVGKDTTQTEFDRLNTPSNYKGEKTHLLVANEIPPVSVNVGGTLASWNKTQTGSQARVNLSGTYAANWAGGYEVYTDGSGGGATNVLHNNLQPYRVLNYIIKAKNTVPIIAVVEDSLTSTSTTNALSAKQGNILCSLISRPNLFLNSDFRIWQRALSQTVSGYASDDKWYNENNGTTKSHSRQTFAEGQTLVPNNPVYFSRTVVTSVTNANNYCVKSQKIENVRTLARKTGTLSFYARSDSTKYIAIELIQFFGTGGSSVVTGIGAQRVLLSNSWQKYVVHVDVPGIGGKTVMGGNFLQVCFWLEAGAAFGARSSNIGQQSGTFDIAQVKLEEGNIATPFVPKSLAEDLRDCQRYYEKSYDIDVIPATNSIVGMNAFHGTTQGAGVMAATVFFKVTKCKTPVVLPFTYAGVQGSWGYDRSGANGDVTTSAANIGQNSFQLQASLGVGWTNCTFYGHWIADADL